MIVGVKYCGGCNVHYRREHAIKEIISAFPQHNFVIAQTSSDMDLLLVMAGCSVACVNVSEYELPLGVFWLTSGENLQKVIDELTLFGSKDKERKEVIKFELD